MKKILIIEDDTDLREALEVSCAQAGYEVEAVETSTEGLTYVQKHLPDLIFLDIMTHSMTAGMFIDRVKEMPQGNTCHIIVITNLDNEIVRNNLEAKKIDAFFLKAHMSLGALTKKAKELLGE